MGMQVVQSADTGDRTPAEAGAEARAFIVYRGGAS